MLDASQKRWPQWRCSEPEETPLSKANLNILRAGRSTAKLLHESFPKLSNQLNICSATWSPSKPTTGYSPGCTIVATYLCPSDKDSILVSAKKTQKLALKCLKFFPNICPEMQARRWVCVIITKVSSLRDGNCATVTSGNLGIKLISDVTPLTSVELHQKYTSALSFRNKQTTFLFCDYRSVSKLVEKTKAEEVSCIIRKQGQKKAVTKRKALI